MLTKMVWKIGGGENVAQTVLEMMKDSMGIEPVLVVSDAPTNFRPPFPMENFRMNTYDLIPLKRNTVLKVAQKMVPYSFKVKKCVKEYNPDVIISIDPYLAVTFRLVGIRKPIVLWLHNSIEQQFHKRGLWPFVKVAFEVCDAIIVLNEGMKQEIRQLFPSALPKTVVIRNPVDVSWVEGVYNPSSMRFTFVGRIYNKQKRLDRLVKAFHLFKSDHEGWELVLIGDGPDRVMVDALIKEYGLEQSVRVAGWQKNPWMYLSTIGGARALVLSSDFEGSPLTIVEAMMNGLPVVSLDCPVGPSEIIKEGENGFLVPFGVSEEETVKNLARALSEMADNVSSWKPTAIEASVEEFRPSRLKVEWEKFLVSICPDA